MMSRIYKRNRRNERGNVLFLILIAVALFAALSYAVTQSSRSGGGNANEETNLVRSAAVTQYPASVRTAIIRMMVSSGVDATELEFNYGSALNTCTTTTACVFHPSGGGASPGLATADVMSGGVQGIWLYNSAYQIGGVGLTTGDESGSDIVAFLPGLSLSVCKKINTDLGIAHTDDNDGNLVGDAGIAIANVPTNAVEMDSSLPVGIETYAAAKTLDGPDFDGQPYGCADFNDGTAGTAAGDLVYYHVLVER
jgi:hypothetical protein